MKTISDPADYPRTDAEFENHLPRRSDADIAGLEAEIVAKGAPDDPIIVWASENIVADGMTRLRICARHNLPFKVEYREFESREAVMAFIEDRQLDRRNLTDKERTYYLGRRYNREKQAQGGAKAHGETLPGGTAKKIGKKVGAAPATVKRAGKLADAIDRHAAVDPKVKQKILASRSAAKTVIDSAPVLCARCTRVGAVRDCPQCQKEADKAERKAQAKRLPAPRRPPKDSLFEEPAPPPPEAHPFAEIMSLTTKLSGLITKAIKDHGEAAKRLHDYLSACGLVDHPPKGEPKFLALAGVKGVVESAGEINRPALTDAKVQEMYKTACGAVPWVPPAVKFRRERGNSPKGES